jgi:phosphoglucomutase
MPVVIPQLPMPEIEPHNNLIDRPYDIDPAAEVEDGMEEMPEDDHMQLGCDHGPDHSDLDCDDCGNCMDHCECDNEHIDESLTDNDYSRNGITGKGKVVNPNNYMYKIPAYKQRVVKGNLGDNSLAETIYSKFFS